MSIPIKKFTKGNQASISMVSHPDSNPARQEFTSVNFCRDSILKDLMERWAGSQAVSFRIDHCQVQFMYITAIYSHEKYNHSNSRLNLL